MQRRLCSAILFLQAVVLGLTTPVLIVNEHVAVGRGLGIGLGLMLACLVAAGMLRKRWAYQLGWAIQIAAIALGFLLTAMFTLGVIFAVLWFTAYRLGATIDRDKGTTI